MDFQRDLTAPSFPVFPACGTARTRATDALDKVVRQARHAVGVLDALIRAQLDPSDPMLTD